MTLNDSLILNNSMAWGAINSTGWLTLTSTIVQGNTAVGQLNGEWSGETLDLSGTLFDETVTVTLSRGSAC